MKKQVVFGCIVIGLAMSALRASAEVSEITFDLVPQPKFLSCLAASSKVTPTAQVVVSRGQLSDVLILELKGVKPNLGFDLFTIQNSNLLANGTVNPDFKNFGLAWYQTDVQADSNGNAEVAIKTILLDQIFGFDPASGLEPTHTFNVGFWFNNPQDAAACGFNTSEPTPFNGEQNAGPNAMISLPNATTNLGPLCTSWHKEGSSFVCNE